MLFVNLTCETPNHSFIALFEQFSAPCPTRQQTAYSAIRSSCNRRSLRTPVCYCLQQNTQKRRDFRWLWLFLHRLLPPETPFIFPEKVTAAAPSGFQTPSTTTATVSFTCSPETPSKCPISAFIHGQIKKRLPNISFT